MRKNRVIVALGCYGGRRIVEKAGAVERQVVAAEGEE